MRGAERSGAPGGRFWAAVPLVLGGAMLLGFGVMVGVATDDPGFSVERDYYQKALEWDVQSAEIQQSAQLGWRFAPELRRAGAGAELVAALVDRAGVPVRGAAVDVEAFPVARGSELVRLSLVDGGAGEYRARIPRARPGIWELRFTARRGGERFTQISRVEIGGVSP